MKTIKELGKKYKGLLAIGAMALMLAVALVPSGVAFAACPEVPTDCTLTDLVENGFGSISDAYTEALVTFIPMLIAIVVPISVAMYFLYKGWGWIRRASR